MRSPISHLGIIASRLLGFGTMSGIAFVVASQFEGGGAVSRVVTDTYVHL